jgi:hypothetical protein
VPALCAQSGINKFLAPFFCFSCLFFLRTGDIPGLLIIHPKPNMPVYFYPWVIEFVEFREMQ